MVTGAEGVAGEGVTAAGAGEEEEDDLEEEHTP